MLRVTTSPSDSSGGSLMRPRGVVTDRVHQTSPGRTLMLLVVVGVAGLLLLNGVALFTFTLMWIYGLFALSTNIMLGWIGRISFGQGALFGVGAYFVSLSPEKSWPAPLSVVVAGLLVAAVAVVVSLMTRRSTGLSFAILTLVVGQVLFEIVNLTSSLGGETGLSGITPGPIGSLNVGASYRTFALYTVVVVGVCVVGLSWLRSSYLGLSMRGVRDNSRRSSSLGVPVSRINIIAFSVAGLFAGIAGALYAQQQSTVNSSLLNWSFSGDVVVMCLVGGMYSFWGPVVGAALYAWLTTAGFAASANSNLYLGIVLLTIVLVVPGGIVGGAELVRDSLCLRVRSPRRFRPSRGDAS